MAKACDCGFILEAFERDPRLACLPLAVRALWLVLVRRMQQLGQSGLVFGSDIPNPREIAMMVAVSETELETHLEPLLARGLLVRRADGALESPLLAARQKRAETARINGLKGGRPRRDGAPVRQREMIMAVPGGAAAGVAETQEKPTADGFGSVSGSLAKLAKPSAEEEAKPAELPADWSRICDAAMDAAGFDAARWTGHCGKVAAWWRQGASEALILSVIRRVMARGNVAPSHFGYFDSAMREALAAEGARGVPVVASVVDASLQPADEFLAEVAAWENGGRMGRMPVRRVRECAA
jgi:hypothetical protein